MAHRRSVASRTKSLLYSNWTLKKIRRMATIARRQDPRPTTSVFAPVLLSRTMSCHMQALKSSMKEICQFPQSFVDNAPLKGLHWVAKVWHLKCSGLRHANLTLARSLREMRVVMRHPWGRKPKRHSSGAGSKIMSIASLGRARTWGPLLD